MKNDRIPHSPPKISKLPFTVERPLWSVMIPTYNCLDYIASTLQSVLQQDQGPKWMQIMVVDDCSSDGDVSALVEHIGKGRVSFYRQPINVGSLRNFETCLNLSLGQYVHILHGDDKVEPGYYQEVEKLFEEFPSSGAAFTNFQYIDHEDFKIPIENPVIQQQPGIIPDFRWLIARRQLIQPPAISVKRSVYEDVGSFYAVHFGEDWEMWTRIAFKYPVAYSPKTLASYRASHGIGITHNHLLSGSNITDIKNVIQIIQGYLPDEKKESYKKMALQYYAIYSIRIANSQLLYNRAAAFRQIKGAWSMSKTLRTAFWSVRFYMMHLLKYKQIQAWIRK